jgi:hypothetical protein
VLAGTAAASGEAGETHAVTLRAKLYAFVPTDKSWLERGHGTLTLNDAPDTEGSRLGGAGVFVGMFVLPVALFAF